MSLSRLTATDRMQLMRFVCSFAWADLKVHERERALIARMVRALRLDGREKAQVERWLESPPEADPAAVPLAHRQLFLDAVKAVIVADGTVTVEEREQLKLLDEMLR
jgi:uncharacterized tellurite resistance protein B-like protein